MSRRILISVTSDLNSDQRVHKVSQTCHDQGFEVVLVGRLTRDSLDLEKRDYRTRRFWLPFQRKAGFYAFYNIRLFIYLVFHRADILISNDLDTLPANFLASRLKGIPLIYDSHEYFTEVPELQHRPLVKWVWTRIEKGIFPRLRHVYTVNATIAGIYRNKYYTDVQVIRNLPFLHRVSSGNQPGITLPENRKILIYQGAGIHRDRGAEELVISMAHLNPAEYYLVIAGSGEVIGDLKKLVLDLQLGDRVRFIDRMPFHQLAGLTRRAHLGLTLDKPTNLNYRYSLPNKLFDYIHAGIPVLASDLPEIKAIIDHYEIGECLDSLEPLRLAAKIASMFSDPVRYASWKAHTQNASRELCWEKESLVLISILKSLEPLKT